MGLVNAIRGDFEGAQVLGDLVVKKRVNPPRDPKDGFVVQLSGGQFRLLGEG